MNSRQKKINNKKILIDAPKKRRRGISGLCSRNSWMRGFSLIEMLVVVVIVGVGLVGALSFYNINLNSQFEAKNTIVASGLAQEGVELVRNLIEYKKLNGEDWNSKIKNDLLMCNRIDVSSLVGTTRVCNNGGSDHLCYSNGQYKQCSSAGGEVDTGITRSLLVEYNIVGGPSPDKDIKVTCTVTWNNGTRTTTATEILYNNSY